MNRTSSWSRKAVAAMFVALTPLAAQNASAALINIRNVTSDADSGINVANNYTHAIDLNRAGADTTGGNDALPLTINGVPFTGITSTAGGTDVNFGGSYTSTGINSTFDNRNVAITNGGVKDLLDDFFHNGNGAGGATPGTEVITLSGLTAGQTYKTTFFTENSFAGNLQDITVNDNGTIRNIARSGNNASTAAVIELTATANGAGQIVYTFDAQSNGDSMHQYGFTNEQIAATRQVLFPNIATAQNSVGFTVATDDLLTGISPIVVGNVNSEEGRTTTNVSVLTNGIFGPANAPQVPDADRQVVAIHNNTTLTFNLDLQSNSQGYDITGIDVYTGWNDGGRDNQEYSVLVSFVDDPTSFVLLQNVLFAPPGLNPSDTAVFMTSPNGDPLATNVAAVRFAFLNTENTYVGYREFDVHGVASAVPEPTTALLGLIGGIAMLRRRQRAIAA